MTKTIKDFTLLLLATLIITLLIWLPHLLKLPDFYQLNFSSGFNTIYRNYDGLYYIEIAKTLYNKEDLVGLPPLLTLNYYPAHFPGFPLLILLFAPLFGFLKSMLFVSILFTFISAWAFYLLIKHFNLSSQPLFLSLVFLVLPARWLIVHSVGSAEPVFIFFVIASIYSFLKFEKTSKFLWILLCGIFGAFAQFVRPPGALLFIALSLAGLWYIYQQTKFKDMSKTILEFLKLSPLILIPLSLIGVFYIYQINYGDFWAYFKTGDNIHLVFPPFQVFNKSQFWVGDIWLEDIIYILILELLAGLILFRKKLYVLSFFVLTFFTAAIFIAHRDISRYTLPVIPFILIAFEKVLTSREFKIVLAILMLGIYLYSQNFLLNNIAPIDNLNRLN